MIYECLNHDRTVTLRVARAKIDSSGIWQPGVSHAAMVFRRVIRSSIFLEQPELPSLHRPRWAGIGAAPMATAYRRGKIFHVAFRRKGRLVLRSLQTANKWIARDKARKIDRELLLGEAEDASQLPLATIIAAFCEYRRTTRPYKSYRNDLARLRAFFGPICDALKPGWPSGVAAKHAKVPLPDKYAHVHVQAAYLEDVTPALINRFIADRIQQNAWAPKTANSMREILHRLFSYAIKHHDFRSRDRRYPNPVAAVERQLEVAPEIRFLTLDQVEAQLRALEGHPVIRALVATYIYAGLRREEALWLTEEDVDLEQKIIRVRAKTIDGARWQPKTRRNRAVPISGALLAILQAHKAPCQSLWYFPSPTGKRWDPDNYSQDLRKINKARGLDWGCLDFRHTFGSQLAQKGESLYKIATLMGNSPAICQRHYAALIPEAMHDTVEFPTDLRKADHRSETKSMLEEVLRQVSEIRRTHPSLSR